jgi:hypothetical protein
MKPNYAVLFYLLSFCVSVAGVGVCTHLGFGACAYVWTMLVFLSLCGVAAHLD